MKRNRKHLEAIVERIARAAAALGLAPAASYSWRLESGSAVNGIGWRLVWTNNETGGHYRPFGMDDFLGMTYGEAENSLYRIADVLDSVSWTIRNG